jgi:hypothetical protein
MAVGSRNITFGWILVLAGLVLGAFMGMWSFNGPLASPVGDYTALPRRLFRLSHLAFIALGILNILYGYGMEKDRLTAVGSYCMIIGGGLLPLVLLGAVFIEGVKYASSVPAILVLLAVAVLVKKRLKN